MGLIIRLLWSLTVGTVELVFWVLHLFGRAFFVVVDIFRAGKSMRGGELRCPNGHLIPMEAKAECEACHFIYEGSLLACPNPECQAPNTAFLNCPECRVSVRNPFRWGRS